MAPRTLDVFLSLPEGFQNVALDMLEKGKDPCDAVQIALWCKQMNNAKIKGYYYELKD